MATISFRNSEGKKFNLPSLMAGITQHFVLHKGFVCAVLEIFESPKGQFGKIVQKVTSTKMKTPGNTIRIVKVLESRSSKWTMMVGQRISKMDNESYFTPVKGQIASEDIPEETTFVDVSSQIHEKVNWTKTTELAKTRPFMFVEPPIIDPEVGKDFSLTTPCRQAYVIDDSLYAIPYRWVIDKDRIPQLVKVVYAPRVKDGKVLKDSLEKQYVTLTKFKVDIGNLKAVWRFPKGEDVFEQTQVIGTRTQLIFLNNGKQNKIIVKDF
jgi:hypothetical protein